MDIADRIQNLRKAKGISQEQLAEQIGVTRQAVSKWESRQSIPDIENVALLSDYFGVTTDHIIKGVEPEENRAPGADPRVFCIIGTALNLIGVFTAVMLWLTRKTAAASFIGLAIIAVGCTVIAAGRYMGRKADITAFLRINTWIVLFIPCSMAGNFIRGFFEGYMPLLSPYPEMGNSYIAFFLCIAAYFVICGVLSRIIARRQKQK